MVAEVVYENYLFDQVFRTAVQHTESNTQQHSRAINELRHHMYKLTLYSLLTVNLTKYKCHQGMFKQATLH
jgi:hypothetical protein